MPATRRFEGSRRKKSVKPSTDPSKHTERVFTDVILTIKPEYAAQIRSRSKNHEFRGYKLREGVTRLWLYESSPVKAVSYIMETTIPRTPGQLKDPSGLGNDTFDAGASSAYAYPVCALFRLTSPITREQMKVRYGITPSQGFCYANRKLVDEMPLEGMECLFKLA